MAQNALLGRLPAMIKFQIQTDGDIPASKQLFDQIRFAIASGQYPPGQRLPSTRQLAMITGLHRNTINKVYQQLEETGLVESMAGSGIYVKAQGHEGGTLLTSPTLAQHPIAQEQIKLSLDTLLFEGFTLPQIKALFLAEIDWRLQCSAQLLVTIPAADQGAGELIVKELKQALALPVQLVHMESLADALQQNESATIVTSRYFIREAEAIAAVHNHQHSSVRVIPLDIHDYQTELEQVKKLPADSCLGIVSLSPGILGIAEILIHSLRGEDLVTLTAQVDDQLKLASVVRSAQTIICDRASYEQTRQAIFQARDDLIRCPDVICSNNYINDQSLTLLKRELGL